MLRGSRQARPPGPTALPTLRGSRQARPPDPPPCLRCRGLDKLDHRPAPARRGWAFLGSIVDSRGVRLPTLGRLTLPATGLLVGALAWGVMSAPAYADADNPEPVTTTEADATEAATAALDQVQAILDPETADGTTPAAGDSRDLTIALRDLRLRQSDLPRTQRAQARTLLQRPPAAYGWTSEQSKAF